MVFKTNKGLAGRLMILMIVLQSLYIFDSNVNMAQAAYTKGMNPGMRVRLEESTINAMKGNLQRFLPRYIPVDKDLPTEYSYKMTYFYIFSWTFEWTKIKYNVPTLDMKDVKVELTRETEYPHIKIKFPAI
jgi:hypothetical protein